MLIAEGVNVSPSALTTSSGPESVHSAISEFVVPRSMPAIAMPLRPVAQAAGGFFRRRGRLVYMKLCGSTSTAIRTPPRGGGAAAISARK
jgi:hypothetical protein